MQCNYNNENEAKLYFTYQDNKYIVSSLKCCKLLIKKILRGKHDTNTNCNNDDLTHFEQISDEEILKFDQVIKGEMPLKKKKKIVISKRSAKLKRF